MPSLWNDFSLKLGSKPELVKKFQALVAPSKKITQPPAPAAPRLQKMQKGLFVTFLSVVFVSHIQKPEVCFVVKTMYFIPASLASIATR